MTDAIGFLIGLGIGFFLGIQLDFETRFPDATVPTLEEVTAFCDAVEIINHSAQQTTQGEL